MKIYFVYILKCSDNTFYTGVTNNLERRLAEHSEGLDPFCYTAKRRPLELVFVQEFQEIKEAIAFEKQIKGWGKRKKLALINEEWGKLKELAECKNETSHKNFKENL
jgi:putative endonuclease